MRKKVAILGAGYACMAVPIIVPTTGTHIPNTERITIPGVTHDLGRISKPDIQ